MVFKVLSFSLHVVVSLDFLFWRGGGLFICSPITFLTVIHSKGKSRALVTIVQKVQLERDYLIFLYIFFFYESQ